MAESLERYLDLINIVIIIAGKSFCLCKVN